MNKTAMTLLAAAALTLSACHSNKELSSTSAYYNFQTQCMGIEHDGSQTLRAFGKGRDKADAIEQARKNAVYDVLFKGIHAGSGDCSQRPLLNGPNDAEKYRQWSNRFLADGGEYTRYCSDADSNRSSRAKADGGDQQQWSVIVRVDREALRQRLVDDGLIANQ